MWNVSFYAQNNTTIKRTKTHETHCKFMEISIEIVLHCAIGQGFRYFHWV